MSEADALKPPPAWKDVWQVPSLIASTGLLMLGVFLLYVTKPPLDFDETLDAIVLLMEEGEFDQGFEFVEELEAHHAFMQLPQRARFRGLRGDLFYMKQQAHGGDSQHNMTQVVSEYQLAEELGMDLDPERIYRMADALITLNRVPEAMEYEAMIPTADNNRRNRILRRLIERQLSLPQIESSETFELLGRLLSEPDITNKDRIWALGRQAEMRIAEGMLQVAADTLLVAIQQLRANNASGFGDLYLQLGRAYYELGEYGKANTHLSTGMKQIDPTDPQLADAMVLLGRVALAKDDVETSQSRFNVVVTEMPGTAAQIAALLGRAETYARQSEFNHSIDDIASGIALHLRETRASNRYYGLGITPADINEQVLDWHDHLFQLQKPELALRYANLGNQLFGSVDNMPPDLLLRLGTTHALLGNQAMAEFAAATPDERERVAREDPTRWAQARLHYLTAAEHFRQRAALLQVDQPAETTDALWNAAVNYDRGGDYKASVDSLREYVRLTANRPEQLRGVFMLAQSYQALQRFEDAIMHYESLIESEHKTSQEAYASYVPLAQCYLADTADRDAIRAERLMMAVVQGETPLEPDAPEFQRALIELGKLYTRASEFGLSEEPAGYAPEAIERLTEAIDRYPDTPEINQLHYWRGHAYRLSAESPALGDSVASRRSLPNVRERFLGQAQDEYDVAIAGFESMSPASRSALDNELLKNALLWRADCAFDLGEYDDSIRMYSDFADRYTQDPATLVALIQVVNAYAEIGKFDAARTAQNRARKVLAAMPDDAFERGLLPASRDVWERWLSWGIVLDDTANAQP